MDSMRIHTKDTNGFELERSLADGLSVIAGVDEVGRGCLAGPVYAAAVVLSKDWGMWQQVDDSKRLTKRKRGELHSLILQHAIAVGIGHAEVSEIESLNILHASRLAMARALEHLAITVDCVLVDGTYAPTYVPRSVAATVPVVDGDAKCPSIAAASIVAKVERDRHMAELSRLYPAYGFDQNAGYGTKAHLAALEEYGPCPHHRVTFGPVANHLQARLMIDG